MKKVTIAIFSLHWIVCAKSCKMLIRYSFFGGILMLHEHIRVKISRIKSRIILNEKIHDCDLFFALGCVANYPSAKTDCASTCAALQSI